MSRIHGRGNKETELALMRVLRAHGITGWCRHQPIFGKPDFIFREARLAVFVDGCFWHGCPKCYRRPTSNRKYWDAKVNRNRARDRTASRQLHRRGWRIVRIWGHAIKSPRAAIARITSVLSAARIQCIHPSIKYARST